jgi:N-acetyl-anhydromuramyl-L-alanine amidase AmpD
MCLNLKIPEILKKKPEPEPEPEIMETSTEQVTIFKGHISENYFKEIYEKLRLVIHFTAGNMPGAENWLNFHTNKVNVPFIICRNGNINEYFDPKYWAYHTGVGLCRESIGIEIECWGGLDFDNGYFLPWTGDKSQAVSPERVLTTSLWRGKRYWEMLTFKQVISLDYLVKLMINDFSKIRTVCTHADINAEKTDYPPEYKQVYDIVNKYNNSILLKSG